MENMKKSFKKIIYIKIGLFLLLILFFVKFMIWDRFDIISSPYNPRLRFMNENVIRGEIKDQNGKVIAKTKKEGDKWIREYPYGADFIHILGYESKIKTGMEAQKHFDLTSSKEPWYRKLKHLIWQEPFQGNNIKLTLNADLQKKANQLMTGKKGAIVVIEPSTGKILSMVSYPNFNPYDLEQNWEILNQDTKNSPLLNRATQGLYPPGSIFKLVTTVSAMQTDWWENFSYHCNGEALFNETRLRCYNEKAHGDMDIHQALIHSCNTTFAEIGVKVGGKEMRKTAEKLLFNYPIPGEIQCNNSTFAVNEFSSIEEIAETSIGQGKTLVTPFHMALIASAFANQGILMQPYMVDSIENAMEKVIKKTIPKQIGMIIAPEIAEKIKSMMMDVVDIGTGRAAKIEGISVAGKTGTAENEQDQPHAWFIGFAPVESPQVAVAVIVENGGAGGKVAAPIGKELIKDVVERR